MCLKFFSCLIPSCCHIRCISKKKYTFPFTKYNIYINEVIDGDTFFVTFIFNGSPFSIKIRLMGVDAPEISSKNPYEKKASLLIKEYLKKNIEGKYGVTIMKKWDKYGGRIVGSIMVDNVDISMLLISNKFGKSYEGCKKEEWNEEELANIIHKLSKINHK